MSDNVFLGWASVWVCDFVKSLTKEDNSKMVEVTEVCNLLMGMFQKVQYIA